MRRACWKAIALLLVLLLVGGSVPRRIPTRAQIIRSAVDLPDFSFFAWELNALGRAIFAGEGPLDEGLDVDAQVGLVRAYFERAKQIAVREDELERLVSEEASAATEYPESGTAVGALGEEQEGMYPTAYAMAAAGRSPTVEELRLALAALRRRQDEDRALVEAILESQIREEIRDAELGLPGFVWPPVQFAFIEPPA